MASNKEEQLNLAEGLQLKLLKRFDKMLDEGSITATDMATLSRLLMSNGWNIDPSRLPENLKGILSDSIDPSEIDEDNLEAH